MITLNINVSLINKDRLYEGKKGKYLDAVLIETPNSDFGDYMIVESISKEEREAGGRGTILGNAKILVKSTRHEEPQSNELDKTDDLPF